ncbi:unnamed protein product [Lactuca saligna]|uniref:Uncharacterized protein n=1 Tax=Lactuca saligna TaxID=75948 RepID=A0AA35ZS15_LACSI|nr:unnamed protein product [Lactuca saligna]
MEEANGAPGENRPNPGEPPRETGGVMKVIAVGGWWLQTPINGVFGIVLLRLEEEWSRWGLADRDFRGVAPTERNKRRRKVVMAYGVEEEGPTSMISIQESRLDISTVSIQQSASYQQIPSITATNINSLSEKFRILVPFTNQDSIYPRFPSTNQ